MSSSTYKEAVIVIRYINNIAEVTIEKKETIASADLEVIRKKESYLFKISIVSLLGKDKSITVQPYFSDTLSMIKYTIFKPLRHYGKQSVRYNIPNIYKKDRSLEKNEYLIVKKLLLSLGLIKNKEFKSPADFIAHIDYRRI